MFIARLLRLLRGSRHLIFLSVLFGLLFSGIGLIPPLLLRELVRWIEMPELRGSFLLLGALVLGAYVARGLCRYAYGVTSHVAAYRTLHRLLTTVYEHLQRMSPAYYTRERTGRLVSRSIGDIEAVEDFVAHGIPETVLALVIPPAMITVLLVINWRLALLVLLPFPVIVFFLALLVSRTKRYWRSVRGRVAELVALVQDRLSGMVVIQSFVRERQEAAAVARASAAYRDSIVRANKWSLVPSGTMEAASGIGLVMVIWAGGPMASRGMLNLPDLVVFLMYLGRMFMPLIRLANLSENLQKAAASAERVFELLDEPTQIVDAPDACVPDRVRWEIEFDDVTFGYDPAAPVLKNVSFAVEPGEVVALVGPTGVGKSTATKLVPRFYDVQAGAVCIGGHDVRTLKLDFLRSNVAMVLQDVFLFHGTVRQNILFGRPDATDEEVHAAARAANAEDFILELPQGYDTVVGERGVRLSGGQKQRLSIARALLKDSPILILDEAMCSVDPEAEALIQEALSRLTVGRTVLVIAHRLSTIQTADRIVVLADGGVEQIGTHDALMAGEAYYARMFRLQAGARDWRIGAAEER